MRSQDYTLHPEIQRVAFRSCPSSMLSEARTKTQLQSLKHGPRVHGIIRMPFRIYADKRKRALPPNVSPMSLLSACSKIIGIQQPFPQSELQCGKACETVSVFFMAHEQHGTGGSDQVLILTVGFISTLRFVHFIGVLSIVVCIRLVIRVG